MGGWGNDGGESGKKGRVGRRGEWWSDEFEKLATG